MRELHLPDNPTERDLDLAEQIARAFDSTVLHVCWSERRGPCAPVRPPSAPPQSLSALLGELAGGLLALWDALVAGLEQRAGRAPSVRPGSRREHGAGTLRAPR